MKIVICILLMAISASSAYFIGRALENARIQATCDDPNAPTILGGSTYICLNGPTWNAIVKQLKERGA